MKKEIWRRAAAFMLSGAMIFTTPAMSILAKETVPIEVEKETVETEEVTELAVEADETESEAAAPGEEETAADETETEADTSSEEETVVDETETEAVTSSEEETAADETETEADTSSEEETAADETETESNISENTMDMNAAALNLKAQSTSLTAVYSDTDLGYEPGDEKHTLDSKFAIGKETIVYKWDEMEQAYLDIPIKVLHISSEDSNVEIVEEEDDWILSGKAVGTYTITITYRDQEEKYPVQTTTFQLTVVDVIYYLDIEAAGGKEKICPGESMTLSAIAYAQTSETYDQLEDYTVRWSVTAETQDGTTVDVDQLVDYTIAADTQSITLQPVSTGTVHVSAELLLNGETVDTTEEKDVTIQESYYRVIIPDYETNSSLNYTILPGESISIDPKVYKFDSGNLNGAVITENICFEWNSWDKEKLLIQDADENVLDPYGVKTGKAPFTLIQQSKDESEVELSAVISISDEEIEYAQPVRIRVNWEEVSLKFKGLSDEGYLYVLDEQDVTVEADTSEWSNDKYSIEWRLGYQNIQTGEICIYDPEMVPAGILTTNAEKATIHGDKLAEWMSTQVKDICLYGILKINNKTVSENWCWLESKRAYLDYNLAEDQDEIQRGQQYQYTNGMINYYFLDIEHPIGAYGQAQILDISSSDPSVLKIEKNGSDITITAAKEGKATLTLKLYGVKGEDKVTTLTRTWTVVNNVYEIEFGRLQFCPGEKRKIETKIYLISYQEKEDATLREELKSGYTVSYSGYDKDLLTIDKDGILTAGEQLGISKLTLTYTITTRNGDTKTITEDVEIELVDSWSELIVKNQEMLEKSFYPGDCLSVEDLNIELIEHTTEHPSGVKISKDIKIAYVDEEYATISEDEKSLQIKTDLSELPVPCHIVLGYVHNGITVWNLHLDLIVIERHEHQWSEYTVKQEATCTKTGLKIAYCTADDCDAEDEKTIPLIAHKLKAGKLISEATVLKEEQREYVCEACGYKEIRSIENSILKRTYKLTATSIKLKTNQSTSDFKITGLANGDSIKSIKLSNQKYAKLSKVNLKNGTFTIKALKKKGSATLKITLASPGKVIEVPVKIQTGTVNLTKITGVASKVTMQKGDSQTMLLGREPFTSTAKITCTSSNKKVVKVNTKANGNQTKLTLTAVAPGTAKIIVKAGSKKVSCSVTVSGIGNVKSSITLKKKKSTTLKPKLYGIKGKVSYSSSNPAVVSVTEKGKVTAWKKGTAVITVKAGTYTTTCKVKVK